MGSPHFRVALQAEKTKFSFVLPVLSLIPFLKKLVSCNCFVLLLL